LDFETTGLDTKSDELWEGCAKKLCADGTVTPVYWFRCNPRVRMSAGASVITGVYDEDLKDEPSFAEKAPAFWAAIREHSGDGDVILIAHNGLRFDFSILFRQTSKLPEAVLAGIKAQFPNGVYTADSLLAARKVIVPAPPAGFKLSPLHQFLLNRAPAATHNAEGDVDALVAVLTEHPDLSAAILAQALADKVHVPDIGGGNKNRWLDGRPLIVTRAFKLTDALIDKSHATAFGELADVWRTVRALAFDAVNLHIQTAVETIDTMEAAVLAAPSTVVRRAAESALQAEQVRFCCNTRGDLVDESLIQKIVTCIGQHAEGTAPVAVPVAERRQTRGAVAGVQDHRLHPANEAVALMFAADPDSLAALKIQWQKTQLLKNNVTVLNPMWAEIVTSFTLFFDSSKSKAMRSLLSALLKMKFRITGDDATEILKLLPISRAQLPYTAATAHRKELQYLAHRAKDALEAAQVALRQATDALESGAGSAHAAQQAVDAAAVKVEAATAKFDAAVAAFEAKIPLQSEAQSITMLVAILHKRGARSKRSKRDNEGEEDGTPGIINPHYAKSLADIFRECVPILAVTEKEIDMARARSRWMADLTQARTVRAEEEALPYDHPLWKHHGYCIGPKGNDTSCVFAAAERDALVKLLFDCTTGHLGTVEESPETSFQALLPKIFRKKVLLEALGSKANKALFMPSLVFGKVEVQFRVCNEAQQRRDEVKHAAQQKGRRNAAKGVCAFDAEEAQADLEIAAWDLRIPKVTPQIVLRANAVVVTVDAGQHNLVSAMNARALLDPPSAPAPPGTKNRNRQRAHGRDDNFMDVPRAKFVQPNVMVLTAKKVRHMTGEAQAARLLRRQLVKRRYSDRRFLQAETDRADADLTVGTAALLAREQAKRRAAGRYLSRFYDTRARAHARYNARSAKRGVLEKLCFCLAPTPDHVVVWGADYSGGDAGRVRKMLEEMLPTDEFYLIDEHRSSQLEMFTKELLCHPVSAALDKEGKWRVKHHYGQQLARSDTVFTPTGERYSKLYARDPSASGCMMMNFYHMQAHGCVPKAFSRATEKGELVKPSICARQYRVVEGQLQYRDPA